VAKSTNILPAFLPAPRDFSTAFPVLDLKSGCLTKSPRLKIETWGTPQRLVIPPDKRKGATGGRAFFFQKLSLYIQNIKLGGVKWTFARKYSALAFSELDAFV